MKLFLAVVAASCIIVCASSINPNTNSENNIHPFIHEQITKFSFPELLKPGSTEDSVYCYPPDHTTNGKITCINTKQCNDNQVLYPITLAQISNTHDLPYEYHTCVNATPENSNFLIRLIIDSCTINPYIPETLSTRKPRTQCTISMETYKTLLNLSQK